MEVTLYICGHIVVAICGVERWMAVMEPVGVVSKWLGIEKLYLTKIEGCCPTSIPVSEVVFRYRWFTDRVCFGFGGLTLAAQNLY